MDGIKQRIPDESTLETLLASDLTTTTQTVRTELGELEGRYISFRRRQRLVALALFGFLVIPSMAFFTFGTLLSATVSSWSGLIGTLIFIGSIAAFGYLAFTFLVKGAGVVKAFHAGIDKVLFKHLFNRLGIVGALIEHTTKLDERVFPDTKLGKIQTFFRRMAMLQKPSPEATAMLEVLRQSELITEPFNTTKVDNLFRITTGEACELLVGEFDIKNVTGSGKNRQVKNIFHGYFASYQLPHSLDAKTFVSTEGDEAGFGHLSFWTSMMEQLPKETVLEWGEFEDLLHVATTDKVEARYILTPNFMSDLHDWWKGEKGNIRISFIKDKMYLLYPDNQIRIHDTVSNIDEAEVKEYMLSIARPLLRVLHLISGVRMS
jgi:hypothetical protein